MNLKKAELGTTIKFTDETGTHYFSEGDNIICVVGDDRYVGTIATVGTYKDDVQEFVAFNLNTSDKNKPFSYSSETIKMDDVTYICKNPLVDDIPEMTDEERYKNTYCKVIRNATGANQKVVENAYEHMKKVMDMFDISLDKAIACSLYSVQNQCSIMKPLKEMCNVDVEAIEKMIPDLESAAKISTAMSLFHFGTILDLLGKLFRGEIKE